MITQLVLDDSTLAQLLGDPRIWKIIPTMRNRYDEWQKLSGQVDVDCPPCQRGAFDQKRGEILQQVRSSVIGLPNAQRIQLKQTLCVKTLIVYLTTGGKTNKHTI